MTGYELIIKLLQSEVDLNRNVRIGEIVKHPGKEDIVFPLVDTLDIVSHNGSIYLEALNGEPDDS